MKQEISPFKKSITEAGIWSSHEVETIWDFYVTKSVGAAASQKRSAGDYGLKELPFDTLLDQSGVSSEKREVLMADNMNGVLEEYDFIYCKKKTDGTSKEKLIDIAIDIDNPRVLCLQPYSISDRGKPVPKGGGKGVTLLSHMRNSFAHGCTYFFDNGMALFEDRAAGSNGKITAMILIPQSALTEWIKIIDNDARYYFKDSPREKYKDLVIRPKAK